MIGLLLAATISLSPAEHATALSEADPIAVAESEYRAGLEARADAARARPHFHKAATAYEQLWLLGHRSPALARNLAQSYLLAGDLAHAIRAYHLGQRIAPHDPELRAGLAFAREQVRYPINGILFQEGRFHDRNSLLRYGPAWLFGVLAAGVYSIALLALARGWMSRRPAWWIVGGTLTFVAILIAGSVLWEDKHLADESAMPLVVVAGEGAALHRGNGHEFPLRIPERLPEGLEMVVLAERGGWLQVQLAGGAVGWVDAEHVVRVGP